MMRAASLPLVFVLSACGTDNPTRESCNQGLSFDVDAGAGDPAVVFLPEGQPEARVRVDTLRVKVQLGHFVWENKCMLVGLTSLPDDAGALWLFPISADWQFTTEGVLIPTDFIFIRSSASVMGVVADADANSPEVRTLGGDSRDVLEVNGGWAARHGVGPDTMVRFENLSP